MHLHAHPHACAQTQAHTQIRAHIVAWGIHAQLINVLKCLKHLRPIGELFMYRSKPRALRVSLLRSLGGCKEVSRINFQELFFLLRFVVLCLAMPVLELILQTSQSVLELREPPAVSARTKGMHCCHLAGF